MLFRECQTSYWVYVCFCLFASEHTMHIFTRTIRQVLHQSCVWLLQESSLDRHQILFSQTKGFVISQKFQSNFPRRDFRSWIYFSNWEGQITSLWIKSLKKFVFDDVTSLERIGAANIYQTVMMQYCLKCNLQLHYITRICLMCLLHLLSKGVS